MSTWSRNSSVAGEWPIATNMPSTLRSAVLPVFRFLSLMPVTDFGLVLPRTSSTPESQITLIFGLANRRCCIIFSARKLSLR
jgi:hypothetical protein